MKLQLLQETKETILSNGYSLLIQDEEIDFSNTIDTNQDEVPFVFKHYEYPVSSWPVIVSSEMTKRLTRLSTRIPKLLHQIPLKYFGEDLQLLSDFYFNGDVNIGKRALACHHTNVEVSCRLDLIQTSESLEVLEINVGSSVGGWQISFFDNLIRNIHPVLTNPKTAGDFNSKNTLSLYLQFLIETINQYLSLEEEINVFVCLDSIENVEEKNLSLAFLNELFTIELTKKNMRGMIYSDDVKALQFENKAVFIKGKQVHAFLVVDALINKMPDMVYEAFLNRKIYLPDHIGTNFIDDKRNFALLRQLAEKGAFNEEDTQLIKESIPWTSIIEDKEIDYNGKSYDTRKLLIEQKNHLVIKPATGFQGTDVYVGKFSNDKEWLEAIDKAFGDTHFIVQKFCNSKKPLAPNSFNEWVSHKLIWGSFGFGEKYGGVWVRMSDTQSDKGVINSANGATEAIVYELKKS
ncbi:hypothetical protein [Aquimarina sp. RZ0]|uniref:hypothetical protein n=1 Tax=Aquimarina sp. RZ0 TaxID=2607730 RepID=UPI0011F1767D|nr:hypothetical protein [Aquimarina sp. RZ0]KAA1243808.1 hypothetical protein F0000_19445 [Aquimarina sp. RZ0]